VGIAYRGRIRPNAEIVLRPMAGFLLPSMSASLEGRVCPRPGDGSASCAATGSPVVGSRAVAPSSEPVGFFSSDVGGAIELGRLEIGASVGFAAFARGPAVGPREVGSAQNKCIPGSEALPVCAPNERVEAIPSGPFLAGSLGVTASYAF
jgi:hypothetical protein